jgi:hypothetical protein
LEIYYKKLHENNYYFKEDLIREPLLTDECLEKIGIEEISERQQIIEMVEKLLSKDKILNKQL